jgi:hypothetical protein
LRFSWAVLCHFFVTGLPVACQFQFVWQFPLRQPCQRAIASDRSDKESIEILSGPVALRETRLMRALALVLVAALIVGGIYFFYVKKMPTSDSGTAPTQAISLTGVRMDLTQIAQAERTYFASNGHCVNLDDLSSSGLLNLAKTERDGYTYRISCGEGAEFTVTARHAPAPPDSPIRYPTLTMDQNMRVGEIQ